MNKYNIISDIAGRFDELQELLKLMPPAEKIILVGDLVDRGPKSKEVVEWAMTTPNVITLLGNHELMMLGAAKGKRGDTEDHLYNGGRATLKSYGIEHPREYPEDHIDWIANLPVIFQDEGLFVSHAPWLGSLEYNDEVNKTFVVWNRDLPFYMEGVFQVHGHNSEMTKYEDWGICIDACFDEVLTGLTFPNKEIYQVPYKD